MRLTLKLIAALTCMILLVLSINAVVRVKREAELFEQDILRDNRLLARTLAGAVERIWTTVGEAEALDLVEDTNARKGQVDIRWHWLTDVSPLPADVKEALAKGHESVTTGPSPSSEQTLHSTYVPVVLPEGRRAAIEVSESLAAEQRYVRKTIFQAITTTVVLVLLCGLLATGLGITFVGRPVRQLVEQARRIGVGDLSPHGVADNAKSGDEIGDLAREMDTMRQRLVDSKSELDEEISARLAAQDQLRHAERLVTIGKLAAGVAHEIGTPLNVITGYAQLIKDDNPEAEDAHRHAVIINEQAHRVARIVRQLLDFARQRTLQRGAHDLVAVVRQVVELLDSMAEKRGVKLELVADTERIDADVDAVQIQQVLTNLIVNGIHAMRKGGLLAVRVGQTGANEARLTVEDNGDGIAADVLPRIFEPFFTTKEVGDGTGLGLSVAYGIVKEHAGSIEVESVPGSGTCFVVTLPLDRHESAS